METDTKKSYYMINMQKVLFVAGELHKRGYGKMHIIPSLSPSGLYWRCSFVVMVEGEKKTSIASHWIGHFFEENEEIKQTIQELTDLFEKDNMDFLIYCKGESPEYVEWYNNMLAQLQEEDLPYAFSDYFGPTDYWQITGEKKIYTLADERDYYF